MEYIQNIFKVLEQKIFNFAPDFLLGFSILILGLFIAYCFKLIAKKLVLLATEAPQKKSSYSRVISSKQLIFLSAWMGKLVFWMTILIFSIISFEVFGIHILSTWSRDLAAYIPNILAAIVVIIFGNILAKVLRDLTLKSFKNTGLQSGKVISIIVYISILLISTLVAIKQVGIEIEFLTSMLLVFLSGLLLSMALSFGIGSAPILRSILSTYYIRQILKIGDTIEVEGLKGQVVKTTPTSIIIHTGNKNIIIPSRMLSEKIIEKED